MKLFNSLTREQKRSIREIQDHTGFEVGEILLNLCRGQAERLPILRRLLSLPELAITEGKVKIRPVVQITDDIEITFTIDSGDAAELAARTTIVRSRYGRDVHSYLIPATWDIERGTYGGKELKKIASAVIVFENLRGYKAAEITLSLTSHQWSDVKLVAAHFKADPVVFLRAALYERARVLREVDRRDGKEAGR